MPNMLSVDYLNDSKYKFVGVGIVVVISAMVFVG